MRKYYTTLRITLRLNFNIKQWRIIRRKNRGTYIVISIAYFNKLTVAKYSEIFLSLLTLSPGEGYNSNFI